MPMGHNLSCWSVVTDGGLLSLLCGGRSGLYAIIGTQPAPTATYSGDGRGAGVAVLAVEQHGQTPAQLLAAASEHDILQAKRDLLRQGNGFQRGV